jgi:hypothetical protein
LVGNLSRGNNLHLHCPLSAIADESQAHVTLHPSKMDAQHCAGHRQSLEDRKLLPHLLIAR